MFKKFNTFFKNFDEKILKGGEKPKESPFNFKGERIVEKEIGQGPGQTKDQFYSSYKLDPELKMQSRSLRLKNFGYFMAFLTWYTTSILFITYRLRSDDLETMEKEAQERIRINEELKSLNRNNNIPKMG